MDIAWSCKFIATHNKKSNGQNYYHMWSISLDENNKIGRVYREYFYKKGNTFIKSIDYL